MKTNYKLILFDIDGTIANTDELLVEAINVLYDKYRNGVRTPKEKAYYFSGPPMIDTIKKEFPNCNHKKLLEEYRTISDELCDKFVVGYPGCLQAIKKIKNTGYIVGVVSNKSKYNQSRVFKLLGFDNLFSCSVSCEDMAKPKPDPSGIYIAMSACNITNKKEVIYIGDNYSDYLTALNAGVDCVLCYWGPREKSWDIPCKYKITSFKQLEEILL